MSEGVLLVCPTPIGNLDDVTLRVLRVLGEADVVACEDTRHTKGLLDRHGVRADLVSYHEHNERGRTVELLEHLQGGARVALVSDAGMPAISDPGYVLVRACVAAAIRIEVLPGASAVPVALVASGLPTDRFRFVGFLPRRGGGLAELLEGPDTLVAFEAPSRVGASLRAIAERDPHRPVAVCRELSKLHEEVARGDAVTLAERYAREAPRGEVVLVVGGAPPADGSLEEGVAALRRLVDAGARTRPAATVVAQLTGLKANALYRALTEAQGKA